MIINRIKKVYDFNEEYRFTNKICLVSFLNKIKHGIKPAHIEWDIYGQLYMCNYFIYDRYHNYNKPSSRYYGNNQLYYIFYSYYNMPHIIHRPSTLIWYLKGYLKGHLKEVLFHKRMEFYRNYGPLIIYWHENGNIKEIMYKPRRHKDMFETKKWDENGIEINFEYNRRYSKSVL